MTTSPSSPSPQQQPAIWDAVAPTYAEDIGQWIAFAEEAVRTAKTLEATAQVLDVATGPGTLALTVASRVLQVDATDFSPGMISELEARAKREGIENVTAAVMDAQTLTFADGSFDAAFCLFGFFFFPDRPKAFAELHRVLRPKSGSQLVIATWMPIDKRPIMQIAFDAVAEAMPQFPRPGKGDLQDPAECVREMTEAGFESVEAHTFTSAMKFTSPEHYLDVIVRSAAPIAALRKTIGEEAFGGIRAKILESVKKRIPAEGIELGAEAIFTRGIRP